MTSIMGMECSICLILFIQEPSWITRRMEEERLSFKMEMSTMGTGKVISTKEMEL